MIDLAYIALTLGFFGVMLWYVRGCEHLGRRNSESDEQTP